MLLKLLVGAAGVGGTSAAEESPAFVKRFEIFSG